MEAAAHFRIFTAPDKTDENRIDEGAKQQIGRAQASLERAFALLYKRQHEQRKPQGNGA